MEYNVWRDLDASDHVKNWLTKCVPYFRHLSYEDRRRLNVMPLGERRLRGYLIFRYRNLHDNISIDMSVTFTLTDNY